MHRCGSALWIESMPMFELSKREHKNHRSRTHRTVSSPSFPTFSSFFHPSPRYSRFLLRSLLSVYILGFATGMFWFAFLLYTYIYFLSSWFWFSTWALFLNVVWLYHIFCFFSVSSRFLIRVPEYYILFVFSIRVSKSFFRWILELVLFCSSLLYAAYCVFLPVYLYLTSPAFYATISSQL